MRGRNAWVAGVLGLAVLVAAGAAWWVWRQKRDQGVLFNRLPAENVLLLHVDIERLRHASALAPVLRARVDPDPDYAAFVKQTGFDYQRDLDRAVVCYLPDRVYVLAQGRFDAERLRQYALAQGGNCAGNRLPCRMAASRADRRISFSLLTPNVLGLATAPEPDAVRQLEQTPAPNAEPLALAAGDPAALLWATATPEALDRGLEGQAGGLPHNLSKALEGAQRVYLYVNDRSPNLEVSLKAVCHSESQAAEMRRLVQGMNDFIGGLARRTPWGKVLASAVIRQEQSAIRATWTLDPAVLESRP